MAEPGLATRTGETRETAEGSVTYVTGIIAQAPHSRKTAPWTYLNMLKPPPPLSPKATASGSCPSAAYRAVLARLYAARGIRRSR